MCNRLPAGVCDEGRRLFTDAQQEGSPQDVGLAVRAAGL